MAFILDRLKSLIGLNPIPEPDGPKTLQEVIDKLPVNYRAYINSELPYRRASAVAFLVIVFFLGGPLWYHTTLTYQAPFEVFPRNESLKLTIRVNIATTSVDVVHEKKAIQLDLQSRLESIETVAPLAITWNVVDGGVKKLSDLEVESSTIDDSLDVHIALVPVSEWPFFSATHVHLYKGQWAVVQFSADKDRDKFMNRLVELASEILVDIPHLNSIIRRDLRQKMQPWQIASLPQSHQKRLVWDSAPLSMNYLIQVIHLHENAAPADIEPVNTVKVLTKFASLISHVTGLEISSEHLWDVEVNSYLEKDVQDRWVLKHDSMEQLIKQIDDSLQTVESAYPVLKVAILETAEPVILIDHIEDDSRGAAIASWGAVVPRCAQTDGRVIAALRVLLGMDAELMSGWTKDSAAISGWEMQRLRLRAIIDNSMRAKSAIEALSNLREKISNVVIGDDVAERATEAVRLVTNGLANTTAPSLQMIAAGRRLADEALSHPSLLSLLYFPQDQKVAVYIPIALPTLFPLFGSILALLKWGIGW